MILLCCGSRWWDNKRKIEKEFDKLERDHRIVLVIEGEADGADKQSRSVAEARKIPVCGFFANWAYLGRAAGPIRNGNQIRFIRPDLVLAFHPNITKSKGTRDMVEQARRKGIKVKIIA